mgnify:CR=1 FL=1
MDYHFKGDHRMYYKKIDDLRKKYNKVIGLVSPSFKFYYSLRDEANYLSKDENKNKRIHNRIISEIMKYFYLTISIFIFTFFSLLNLRSRIIHSYQNDINFLISNIIFFITFIALPLYLVFYLSRKIKSKVEKIEDIKNIRYLKNKGIFFLLKMIKNIYIIITILIIILIYHPIYLDLNNNYIYVITVIVLAFYGISRPIHFFVVFIPDIFKKFENGVLENNSQKLRLILIAIGSYINIILDYSILFYICNKINSIFGERVYFEGVTSIFDMTYILLGNGEFLSDNFILKVWYVIMQITIVVLISGNLAIYLSSEVKN